MRLQVLTIRTALVAALLMPLTRGALAGVTQVVGGAQTRVVQYEGSNIVQSDFNQIDIPGTQALPPAVARAKLDRLSTAGEVTASAQGVTVFERAGPGGSGPPNDVGMDLAAFSDDATTSWFVEGIGSETRTVVLNLGETGTQVALPGSAFRAQSRLNLTGAMVISSKDETQDLSGVRVQFSFSILLRLMDGTTSTALAGEVVFVGGPNATAQVESTSGALAGAFLPMLDLGDQVPEMARAHTLIFPALSLPYEYTVTVGQPYELELKTQAQLTTVADGVGAAAVFGLPQEVLQQVFARAKIPEAGEAIARGIRAQVDTSGGGFSPARLLCGNLGLEAAGLMLGLGWMSLAHGGRRRRRRGN